MIQEFSVENFLSFRDKVTIDFLATGEQHLMEELTYEVRPGHRILRMAMIYGANASGKTNLLKAIEAVWYLLYESRNTEDQSLSMYHPFRLDDGRPTSLEMIFWIGDTKYRYVAKFSEKEILYEKLEYTTESGRLSLLYEREKNQEIEFGSTLKMTVSQKNLFNLETLKNHSVVSTLNKKNIPAPAPLKNLYEWVKNIVHDREKYSQAIDIAEQAIKNPKLKDLILDLLLRADLHIRDFKIVEQGIPEKLKKKFSEGSLSSFEKVLEALARRQKSLYFTHQAGDETFDLGFELESRGTQVYFRFARILYYLHSGGHVVLEDEIGRSLHYELLLHFLELYLRNSNNSQLIFTTHNLLLLDESWMLRRDLLWFVEKDRKSGSSILYRASEKGIHKNLSLLNAYRTGKLGAKPLLGSTILGGIE